jgi:hypothetical protein
MQNIKKLFINYVKAVYPQNPTAESEHQEVAESSNVSGGAKDGSNAQMAPHPLLGKATYPELLDIDLSALSKKQLVRVMRDYLRRHYSE